MPRQLQITPTPYKSSYLSIPPTPFSPRLPITPTSPPSKPQQLQHSTHLKAAASLLPPPSNPLHWLWQCHKCNRVYQLGVTRRCLDDGHFFCAGTTVIKKKKGSGKKVVRHAACASEFDYQGWKSFGTWRRVIAEQADAAEALLRAEENFEAEILRTSRSPIFDADSLSSPTTGEGRWLNGRWSTSARPAPLKPRKDCWNKCDYPSECRWGKQFGVSTPNVADFLVPATKEPEAKTPTSFEEILGLVAPGDIADEVDQLEPLSPTKSSTQKAVTEGETKSVSMDDLLESAKRRKRRSLVQVPSPLGANPPSPVKEEAVDSAPTESGRSLDDIELDLKRSWSNLNMPALQEKADAFVKGLVISNKRI